MHTIEKAVIYGHSDGATIALIAATYRSGLKGYCWKNYLQFIEDSGKAAVLATRERAKENNLATIWKNIMATKLQNFLGCGTTWLSDFFQMDDSTYLE